MPTIGSSSFRTAALVFLLALATRLAFCFILVPVADIDIGPRTRDFHTSGDGYLHLARNLVTHGSFTFSPEHPPTTYRPPLFPWALAAVSMIVDDMGLATLLVNCVASALTCVVLWLIISRYAKGTSTLWATLLPVAFPLSIYYCASSFSDTFFALPIALYAYFILRLFDEPSFKRSLTTAMAFALTALAKPILLPFPIALMGYAGLRSRRALGATVSATLLGYLLISPWTYRNYRVSGEFVPVAVGPGFSMLAGHFMIDKGPTSEDALVHGEAKALQLMSEVYDVDFSRHSLKTVGQWNIPKDVDRQFSEQAWKMIAEQPLLLPRKLLINAWRFWYFASTPMKCIANLVINYATLILAVIGLSRLARTHRRDVELLILLVVSFAAVYAMVNISSSRYCLPVLLLLVPFAGLSLAAWLRRPRTDGEALSQYPDKSRRVEVL